MAAKKEVQCSKVTVKALGLVKHLESLPEAFEFLKPVDYKTLGLDDYPLIVKKPMDLSSVKKKLKQNKYSSIGDVLTDLGLIWENCRAYNVIDSPISQQADAMERHMAEYCKAQKLQIGTKPKKQKDEEVKTQSEVITYEEKLDLTESTRRLSHETLAQFVMIVQAECPKALEELDNQRLQIKVDELDRRTFNKLLDVTKTHLKSDDMGTPVKRMKR